MKYDRIVISSSPFIKDLSCFLLLSDRNELLKVFVHHCKMSRHGGSTQARHENAVQFLYIQHKAMTDLEKQNEREREAML